MVHMHRTKIYNLFRTQLIYGTNEINKNEKEGKVYAFALAFQGAVLLSVTNPIATYVAFYFMYFLERSSNFLSNYCVSLLAYSVQKMPKLNKHVVATTVKWNMCLGC